MKHKIELKKWKRKQTYVQRISSMSCLGIFRGGSVKKAPSCGATGRGGVLWTGSRMGRRIASKMVGSNLRATM